MTSMDGDFFPLSTSDRYDLEMPSRFRQFFLLHIVKDANQAKCF